MAWIEAHDDIWNHPKTAKLARTLKIPKTYAAAHMLHLWTWALNYAENGDLSGFDPYQVADGADWPGEPEEFLKAVIEAGYIDPDMMIHDWMDYAGKLIEKRAADRARKRNSKPSAAAVEKNPTEFQRNPSEFHGSSEDSKVTVPKPNLNQKDKSITSHLGSAGDGDEEQNQPGKVEDGEKPEGKVKQIFMDDSVELKLANYLWAYIKQNNPNAKKPNLQYWARDADLMVRVDKRSVEEVKRVIVWCQKNGFWLKNILSMGKLREKYDRLVLEMSEGGNGSGGDVRGVGTFFKMDKSKFLAK